MKIIRNFSKSRIFISNHNSDLQYSDKLQKSDIHNKNGKIIIENINNDYCSTKLDPSKQNMIYTFRKK